MEHFAQGIVAGFAVSMTIPAMYYFNKAALGTLFVVNREIGKALVRVIQPICSRNPQRRRRLRPRSPQLLELRKLKP